MKLILVALLTTGCVAPDYAVTYHDVDAFTLKTKTDGVENVEAGSASPDKVTVELRVYNQRR